MPTFQELYKELTGEVSCLPDLFAQTLINRAWARILDYRMWSFQIVSNAQLFVPPSVTAGSCSTTQGSTALTFDAAAIAALNPLAGANPPLASPVMGVGYQIRVGASSLGLTNPTGPNYSIVSWDGAGNMVIDRPFGESSQSNAPYQVLKCYYAPPFLPVISSQSDGQFARFLSVTNLFSGYAITGRQLYFSQAELNSIDPQRGGQGDAYLLAQYGFNSVGQPVYEMYPNPVNPATYNVSMQSKWPRLTMTTAPPAVSYALGDCLMFLAKCMLAPWAMANIQKYSDLQGVNWIWYRETMKEEYINSLRLCVKEDDELMPSPKPSVYNGGWDFPLGGQFLQAHDLSSIIPNR